MSNPKHIYRHVPAAPNLAHDLTHTVYYCCHPGCRHTQEIAMHDATPRHMHDQALVEMRPAVNFAVSKNDKSMTKGFVNYE